MTAIDLDPPLTEGVRKCMKANKSRDTSPELTVRRALREAGYPGYRLNWKKAPGRPDICYPGRKVAVFVNGCFWHRCPKCALPPPRHNAEYWAEKLERNTERDTEQIRALEEEGWRVVIIWECDLKRDPEGAVSQAIDALADCGRSQNRRQSPRSASDASRCRGPSEELPQRHVGVPRHRVQADSRLSEDSPATSLRQT